MSLDLRKTQVTVLILKIVAPILISFVKNSDNKCEGNLNIRKEMTFQEKLAKFRKLHTKQDENMGGRAVTKPFCTGTSKDARKCAKPIANQLRFGPIEWGENGQVTRKSDGKQL